ncbi:hypothetical protein D3C73_1147470 [compost metagenome]
MKLKQKQNTSEENIVINFKLMKFYLSLLKKILVISKSITITAFILTLGLLISNSKASNLFTFYTLDKALSFMLFILFIFIVWMISEALLIFYTKKVKQEVTCFIINEIDSYTNSYEVVEDGILFNDTKKSIDYYNNLKALIYRAAENNNIDKKYVNFRLPER